MQHYSSWLKLKVYWKGLEEQEFKMSKASAPFTIHPSVTGTCHVRAQIEINFLTNIKKLYCTNPYLHKS